MTIKVIKVSLAILLFICLFDMPYGYYQLVRVSAVIGFSLLAYFAYEKKVMTEVIIFLGLVLLFQPFVKIALGREIWNLVDVIVGLSLLISLNK